MGSAAFLFCTGQRDLFPCHLPAEKASHAQHRFVSPLRGEYRVAGAHDADRELVLSCCHPPPEALPKSGALSGDAGELRREAVGIGDAENSGFGVRNGGIALAGTRERERADEVFLTGSRPGVRLPAPVAEMTVMNVQVMDAGRGKADGYKVDVSRGERIGRVSSEWSSRPNDERFLSLDDLESVRSSVYG